jgi:BolA protein
MDVNAGASRVDRLRDTLNAALSPVALDIVDESHLHAGHVGAREGKGHFRIRIVAQRFAGLAPLARHRLVYAACSALLASDIHALSIDARTPDE